MQLPDGFTRHFRTSRVTDPWEPIYSRVDDTGVCIGLIIADAHCNSRSFLHGGVIASLADNAMGLSFVQIARQASSEVSQAISGAVTVNLSIDYVAAAKLGQWMQINPRVVRVGGSLGFVDAIVTADGNPIARANATFRLLQEKV